MQFDPGHVNEDLQQLLKTEPLNEAIASFMQAHPDATAYTVFQTKSQGGAFLPATAQAMQFMADHDGFMRDHPLAGAYFVPQADSTGKFDLNAYREQLQQGLRVKKDPATFWQEVSYAAAAKQYFAVDDQKNALLRNARGPQFSQIQNQWTQWSQSFLLANPLFAQQLEDTNGKYSRADLLNDMGNALSDPRLPSTPQTDHLKTLFNAYVTYKAAVNQTNSMGATVMQAAQRKQLEQQFASEAAQYIAANPDVEAFYNRLIRPDILGVLPPTVASP
jgi:hypothetical protein